MSLLSIGKFAKLVGVTPTTIRNMHKTGELIPCYISEGGTRYYSEEQLVKFKMASSECDKLVIGYCRVSTVQQRNDLATQVSNVQAYMAAKGYQFEIIEDIGSGINYKNKGLQTLLTRIHKQEVSRVVVLYKDRLMRFGYDLFEYICQLNNVTIEVIDITERNKEQELVDDLIQIITVFANRLYGARSKKTKQLIEGVRSNVESDEDTITPDS